MVFHSNSPPIFEPILLKTGGFSRIYSLTATGWSFERSPHRQVRSSLPDDWIVRQRRQILCKRKILSGRMLRAKGLDGWTQVIPGPQVRGTGGTRLIQRGSYLYSHSQ